MCSSVLVGWGGGGVSTDRRMRPSARNVLIIAYCVYLASANEGAFGWEVHPNALFDVVNRVFYEEGDRGGVDIQIIHPPHGHIIIPPLNPHVDLSLGLGSGSDLIRVDPKSWFVCTELGTRSRHCTPLLAAEPIPAFESLEAGSEYSMIAYVMRPADREPELRLGETVSTFLVSSAPGKGNRVACVLKAPPVLPECHNIPGEADPGAPFEISMTSSFGVCLVHLKWSTGESHDTIIYAALLGSSSDETRAFAYSLGCSSDEQHIEMDCLEVCLRAAMQAVEVGATQVASSIARARRDAQRLRSPLPPLSTRELSIAQSYARTKCTGGHEPPPLASFFNSSTVAHAGQVARTFFSENHARHASFLNTFGQVPDLLKPIKAFKVGEGARPDPWGEGYFDLVGPVLNAVGCDAPLPRFGEGDGAKFACVKAPLEAKEGCVVISIGCAGEWSFERAVASGSPQCNVHTFDCTGSWEVPPDIASRVTFHQLCVAPRTNLEKGLVSWVDLLPMTGLEDNGVLRPPAHLKMDIEGAGNGLLCLFLSHSTYR